MSPEEHYRRAEAILEKEARYPSNRERELALIHATLATAPVATTEGTFGPGGPSRIHGMTPSEAATALQVADSLRERMAQLADDLERAYPNYGAAPHAAQRIREELAR